MFIRRKKLKELEERIVRLENVILNFKGKNEEQTRQPLSNEKSGEKSINEIMDEWLNGEKKK